MKIFLYEFFISGLVPRAHSGPPLATPLIVNLYKGPFTYYVILLLGGGLEKIIDIILQRRGGIRELVTFSINELFFEIFDKI